jgi:hypothetical protein
VHPILAEVVKVFPGKNWLTKEHMNITGGYNHLGTIGSQEGLRMRTALEYIIIVEDAN